MIGKTYTLTIVEVHQPDSTLHENKVVMSMREFIHLAGELGNFGVDVEVQKDTNPGEIVFRLKQLAREQ